MISIVHDSIYLLNLELMDVGADYFQAGCTEPPILVR